MQTLHELGLAIARHRQTLGLTQTSVAKLAGIPNESLSRLERGRSTEFGARKLLAVLAVLGMELDVVKSGASGSLDALRKERGGEA